MGVAKANAKQMWCQKTKVSLFKYGILILPRKNVALCFLLHERPHRQTHRHTQTHTNTHAHTDTQHTSDSSAASGRARSARRSRLFASGAVKAAPGCGQQTQGEETRRGASAVGCVAASVLFMQFHARTHGHNHMHTRKHAATLAHVQLPNTCLRTKP